MSLDHYAVIGHPVAHSKSPLIHAMFAKQTQQSLDYDKTDVSEGACENFIQTFFSEACNKGLNVTVPHKESAWQIAVEKTERAALAGAVNTLYLQENVLWGDNTDGVGLVNDLKNNHGICLENAKILVIGAGGAVRGVLQPILKESPALVTLCNRTLAKAEVLEGLFKHLGPIQSAEMSALNDTYDVIINGTSASLHGGVPDISDVVIGAHTVTYDMMYSAEQTPFNAWAASLGAAKTMDGLGMLVEQAAEAFYVWRGVRPETSAVIATLRE